MEPLIEAQKGEEAASYVKTFLMLISISEDAGRHSHTQNYDFLFLTSNVPKGQHGTEMTQEEVLEFTYKLRITEIAWH